MFLTDCAIISNSPCYDDSWSLDGGGRLDNLLDHRRPKWMSGAAPPVVVFKPDILPDDEHDKQLADNGLRRVAFVQDASASELAVAIRDAGCPVTVQGLELRDGLASWPKEGFVDQAGKRAADHEAEPVDVVIGPEAGSERGAKHAGGVDRAAGERSSEENADGDGQAKSKRSRFMTLAHAATKSCTNFRCASLHA